MSQKLQIIATLVAKPAKADQLRQLLVPAVAEFRAEPGCDGYVMLEDRKKPGRFMTFETWTDELALQAHMTSPAMKAIGPQMSELLDGALTQDFLTVLVAT